MNFIFHSSFHDTLDAESELMPIPIPCWNNWCRVVLLFMLTPNPQLLLLQFTNLLKKPGS